MAYPLQTPARIADHMINVAKTIRMLQPAAVNS